MIFALLATVFLHEYIHEKGEEKSLPYCNETCYVNCWMGKDCETPCAECKKLARICKLRRACILAGWRFQAQYQNRSPSEWLNKSNAIHFRGAGQSSETSLPRTDSDIDNDTKGTN